jgi:hypothetical protein
LGLYVAVVPSYILSLPASWLPWCELLCATKASQPW